MNTSVMKKVALGLGMAVMAMSLAGADVSPPPRMDAAVDKMLRDMSASLAGAKAMTFEVHSMREAVLDSGQKVEYASNQKVAVRRPDGAMVTVTGDNQDFQFVYDGKTATMLNLSLACFGQTAAPANLDDTMDMLATKYGMVLPLADIVFSDPYKSLTGQLRSGQDLGVGFVFETKCRHLAFRQEGVDWQIWLEDGTNLPRKMVITDKETPAQLKYTAYFAKWDLNATLPAETFLFKPPANAKRVEFTVPPATRPAGAQQ